MMKKRIITIAAVLTMGIVPVSGQVFMTDEAFDNRAEMSSENLGVMVPSLNAPNDQYVPVGAGLTLLTGLGLAYWAGKRKKAE